MWRIPGAKEPLASVGSCIQSSSFEHTEPSSVITGSRRPVMLVRQKSVA